MNVLHPQRIATGRTDPKEAGHQQPGISTEDTDEVSQFIARGELAPPIKREVHHVLEGISTSYHFRIGNYIYFIFGRDPGGNQSGGPSANNNGGDKMRLVKLYDNADQEIIIDMDIKPAPALEKEPFQDWFQNRIADWLESRIAWGKPTLIIAAAVTAISIITMVVKHI